MNTAQIIYALALAGVFLWRGPSPCAWVLLANMAATLAACLAMDLGAMERTDATMTMMLIDFVAGAALVVMPGLPQLLAVGYATNIPIYALNIAFALSESTTYALVVTIGFIQIAVAGIGTGGNDGGARFRRVLVSGLMAQPRRIVGTGAGGMAQTARLLSRDRRGLK